MMTKNNLLTASCLVALLAASTEASAAYDPNAAAKNKANVFTQQQTVSAAGVAGGIVLNNTSRASTEWNFLPANSNQESQSTDLYITFGTNQLGNAGGGAFSGVAGLWAGHDGRLAVGHNTNGYPNARVGPAFNAIGPNAGENNGFEAMAFDGWQQVSLTRYNTSGGAFRPVAAHDVLGVYCFSGYDTVGGGGSTNCASGLLGFATATHSHGANEGAGSYLFYTPDGSTGLAPAVTVSYGGLGGVSVGYTGAGGWLGVTPPTDLGQGTLHTAADIATLKHIRGTGAAPTASICGTATVSGSDTVGSISTNGSCTDIKLNFHDTWAPSFPVCIVQLNNFTPVPIVSAASTTDVTISFASAFNGIVRYLCMGAG